MDFKHLDINKAKTNVTPIQAFLNCNSVGLISLIFGNIPLSRHHQTEVKTGEETGTVRPSARYETNSQVSQTYLQHYSNIIT